MFFSRRLIIDEFKILLWKLVTKKCFSGSFQILRDFVNSLQLSLQQVVLSDGEISDYTPDAINGYTCHSVDEIFLLLLLELFLL